jgi:hypothetical protein
MRTLHPRARWAAIPALGMLATAAVLLTGHAAPASAATAAPASASSVAYTTLVDEQTGLCLDSDYPTNRPPQRNVYALGCDDSLYQEWAITALPDGNVILTDAQTGLCLDSDASDPVAPAGLGVVDTDTCTGSLSQEWSTPGDASGVGFQDAATGLNLDSDYQDPTNANPGTGAVYANTPDQGTDQQWNALGIPLGYAAGTLGTPLIPYLETPLMPTLETPLMPTLGTPLAPSEPPQ